MEHSVDPATVQWEGRNISACRSLSLEAFALFQRLRNPLARQPLYQNFTKWTLTYGPFKSVIQSKVSFIPKQGSTPGSGHHPWVTEQNGNRWKVGLGSCTTTALQDIIEPVQFKFFIWDLYKESFVFLSKLFEQFDILGQNQLSILSKILAVCNGVHLFIHWKYRISRIEWIVCISFTSNTNFERIDPSIKWKSLRMRDNDWKSTFFSL